MKKNLAVVVGCLVVGVVAGQVVRDLHLIRSPYEVGCPAPPRMSARGSEPEAPALRPARIDNPASTRIAPAATGRGSRASPRDSAPEVSRPELPQETLHDVHLRTLESTGKLRLRGQRSSAGP